MKQARTVQVCKPRTVQYIINLHAQEVLTLADQAGEIIAYRLVKGLSLVRVKLIYQTEIINLFKQYIKASDVRQQSLGLTSTEN